MVTDEPNAMTNRTRTGRGQYTTTLDDMETAAQAALLRAQGASYRQIAAAQGVSVSTAHERVRRALAAVPVEAVAELRKVELARLDMLTERAFAELERKHPTISGGRRFDDVEDSGPVFQAIDKIRLLSESRRRLLGLDAPSRVSMTVSDEMSAEIERLAAELGVTNPDRS